ncbi:alpha/beta fold hydrolase [Actinomycetospora termitidis]|uniref:Alpha/beta hydrolase n=1 Tax=Actinomycetospora termitidis TaxID=3053470 RepID=A0ABT7M3L0_9PSEU|nr:alpha/beta hydrolase [Actinomycetospora sp. Odt1-22]MDL5155260.1 alpha/beta hydrolase [Actinomycetospora sp. Odt1-22]
MRTVRSADGTAIAVEQVTDGPRPMVTVAGGPSGRASWAVAAEGLVGRFAVHLADRRGKGDSGDTLPYSFAREHDDLDALCADLGPDVVVAGHSSGAVCVLGAAARGLAASALVLYEPPWPLPGRPDDSATLDRMEAQLAAGDAEGALLTGVRELVQAPEAAIEGMRRSPIWPSRVANAAAWPREGRELVRMPVGTEGLADIGMPVLMLLGEHSAGHLRDSTAAVAAALPHATVVELPGQAHAALQTAPDLVARVIAEYFG